MVCLGSVIRLIIILIVGLDNQKRVFGGRRMGFQGRQSAFNPQELWLGWPISGLERGMPVHCLHRSVLVKFAPFRQYQAFLEAIVAFFFEAKEVLLGVASNL